MPDRKHPRFGQWVRGDFAAEGNPLRDGIFVEVVRRGHGRMNPGVWYRLTDGHGEFWEYDAKHTTTLDCFVPEMPNA